MRKKLIVLIWLFSLVFTVFAADAVKKESPKEELPYKSLATFMEAMMLIRAKYVDKNMVSYQDLLRGAMRGMMMELDPFSDYENPERYKGTKEDTNGSFPGIGVVVSMRNQVVEIVSVMEGAPGAKAGLLPGDIITEIEGKPTRKMTLRECVSKLKGPSGTKVNLKIYRRAGDLTKNVTVERAVIKVPVLRNAGMLRPDIAYFRLTQFSATTGEDIDRFLKTIEGKPLTGIVIDLRNNPGGLLSAAVAAASRFLEKGKLVVSVEGRAEKTEKLFTGSCPRRDVETPMIVLVNGHSASASEIFAACMKDYKRGILVGTKTFGKGSVQVIIPLSDQGALRITTAKYYTPSRIVIHGKGIEPDIAVPVSASVAASVFRHLSENGKKPPVISNGKYRDPQLERAVEILKGVNIFRKSGL